MGKKNLFLFSLGGLSLVLLLAGCSAGFDSRLPASQDLSGQSVKSYFQIVSSSNWSRSSETAVSTGDYVKALRVASLKMMGRDPLLAEISQVSTGGRDAYEKVIRSYLEAPEFLDQMRKYFQGVFEMSGNSGGINYDEPTNLALYLIKNNLDFRDILKSTHCYDNNLNEMSCSSFASASEAAQHAAGAITTKAFLQKWSASFNFRRVARTFKVFACKEYPDMDDPGLDVDQISDTVKTFNCTNCQPACYSCHRDLNPRAALFYKFDVNGVFNLNPTAAEVTKTDTGAVSTVADLLKDGVTPVYHGKPLSELKDYAHYLADSRHFRNCMAQRFSGFMLGTSEFSPIPGDLQAVRDQLSWNGFKIKDFFFDLVTHPAFIKRSSQ